MWHFLYLLKFGGSRVANNWFGESRSRPLGPKIMSMKTFRVFPKWNPKVISPKWSRIILRRFWANLLFNFAIKMAPLTVPDPKCGFSPDFPRFSTGPWPVGWGWELKGPGTHGTRNLGTLGAAPPRPWPGHGPWPMENHRKIIGNYTKIIGQL